MLADNHEQGTGSGAKTENYQCNSKDGTPGLGSLTTQSTSFGNNKNSVFDTNSTWRDTARESNTTRRKTIAGKILRQLRDIQQAHLAYVKADEKRLESRLKENQKHQTKIAEEMQSLEEAILQLLQEESEVEAKQD